MTGSTAQKDLFGLLERPSVASEKLQKLKSKQAELQAQIEQEQARLSTQQRKADTRKKVILGGAVLRILAEESPEQRWLLERLDALIRRESDRQAVGLSISQKAS